MAINKDKKKQIVDKISGAVKDSSSTVFVNFHGLSVLETTELRKSLTQDNVGYTVAKKTLISRVLDASDTKGDRPAFEGELALAYSADLIAPARGVYEFQKKHKKQISILGGIFDGEYKDKEAMMEIATIPAPETLRGMFVNVINSPIQGFVMALNAIAEKKA